MAASAALLLAAGVALLGFSGWARAGRAVRARTIVARPRTTGPHDVLLMAPGMGLMATAGGLGPLADHPLWGLPVLLALAVGLVMVACGILLVPLPRWLLPSWFEPAPRRGPRGRSTGQGRGR